MSRERRDLFIKRFTRNGHVEYHVLEAEQEPVAFGSMLSALRHAVTETFYRRRSRYAYVSVFTGKGKFSFTVLIQKDSIELWDSSLTSDADEIAQILAEMRRQL
jgi:hypothetical protein